jgi:hypothetical protein
MAKPKLTVISERAGPDVVKALEEHLELARSGKVRSIAIASADKGGRIKSDHVTWSQDRGGLYMAIEKLKSRIIDLA